MTFNETMQDEEWESRGIGAKTVGLAFFEAELVPLQGMLMDFDFAPPGDGYYTWDWPDHVLPVLSVETFEPKDLLECGYAWDLDRMQRMTRRSISMYLEVEVSEHAGGGPELRRLVTGLFSCYDGVAFDKYHYDYCWVLRIAKDADVPGGYLYFDYDVRFRKPVVKEKD
ncbi:MAG: hypothetical protein KC900_08840 [Candidatus Omnitrophica bacterium]|nr:hypothetical protein [Candidatus Omnitrophota bacterium]